MVNVPKNGPTGVETAHVVITYHSADTLGADLRRAGLKRAEKRESNTSSLVGVIARAVNHLWSPQVGLPAV